MKKKWWILIVCLILCFLSDGCKKKDATSVVVPLQEVWIKHETEETVFAYTLDEDGNLYSLELNSKAQEEANRQTRERIAQLTQEEISQLSSEELIKLYQNETHSVFLRKYNAKGEREYSKALDDSLASYVTTMAVKDGMVYFIPAITMLDGEMSTVLYSYCPETEEFTAIKELPYFKSVSRIIPMKDCFYILGTNIEGNSGRNSRKYKHNGEKLFCYTISSDKLVELEIEEPIDICVAGDERLCIYAHMGEDFCLLSYDTSREAMKVMAKTEEYKMANVAYCSEQQSVIYWTVSNCLVLSSLSNLEVESELYPDGSFWDNNMCYVNGIVACRTDDGIVQFPLKDVKCESKTLRYIASEMTSSEPFGCGYEIQRNILETDKFALKVMALDKDFDVCLVDSKDSYGYNLKEHGVFYPLNNIMGIQEYLDACFPYVKDAATDRDGNIWLLPISVDIPGLLVRREATDEVLIKKDMTYEEYCLAYEALPEEEKKVTEKPTSFVENFIVQYILDRGTVDTQEFRKILQEMAKSNSVIKEDKDDRYCYIRFGSDYRAYFALQYGADATIYSAPKLTEAGKNVGSCLFLAVNPYSDNLDATLQYISALIAYTMELEDAPLFFTNRKVEENTYDRNLYELYRDGAIAFSVDEDVYEGYSDVLSGNMSVEKYVTETEKKVRLFLYE